MPEQEQTEQRLEGPPSSEGSRSHPHLHEPGDAEDDSTDSNLSWIYEESAIQENGGDGIKMQYGSEDGQDSAPFQDEPVTQIKTESHLLSLTPESTTHPAYRNIDQGHTRLFKILPGEPGSILCINIEPVSLLNAPEYTAISYAWGSAHASWEIKVNGSKFLVPTNLMRFLKQARSSVGMFSSWLWIDMLSIDQSNSPERAEQVVMMPQIFLKAVRVIVWLGAAYGNSDAAVDAFARPRRYWSSKRRRLQLWASPAGQGVQAVCQGPYWQRLWVFQELQMAEERHLMCGSKVIPWDFFEECMLLADNASETHRLDDRTEVIKSSPAMKMIKLTKTPGGSALWSFIKRTKHLRCADVRDRAYALLAVTARAQSKTEVDIIPDYDVPIPAFLNLILRKVYDLFPPKNLEEAHQQCEEVEKVLAVPPGTIYVMEDKQGLYEDVKNLDLRSCRLGPRNSGITLWWAHFYGHLVVQPLLLGSWSCEFWETDQSFQRRHSNADEAATRSEMAGILIDTHTAVSLSSPIQAVEADIRSLVFDELLNRSESSGDEHPSDFLTKIAEIIHVAILKPNVDLARMFLAPGGFLATLDCQLSLRLLVLTGKTFDPKVMHKLDPEIHHNLRCLVNPGHKPFSHTGMRVLQYDVLVGAIDSVLAILSSQRCELNPEWSLEDWGETALHVAANLGSVEILRILLDAGHADESSGGSDPRTALMLAASGPSSDCVKMLLEKPVCHVDETTFGGTALHRAVRAGNADSVRLLLDLGKADITIRSGYGETALTVAAKCDNTDFVRIFLEDDRCDVNAIDNWGGTALTYAVKNGNIEMLQRLLGRDAKVNTVDFDGKTPLDIAHDKAKTFKLAELSLESLLLQAGAKYH